jgi:hypothetical protein
MKLKPPICGWAANKGYFSLGARVKSASEIVWLSHTSSVRVHTPMTF